jgi:hypothetical protein
MVLIVPLNPEYVPFAESAQGSSYCADILILQMNALMAAV